MTQTEAYVYDAIRTPRGKGKESGSLHGVKPISLTVGLINEIRHRNPDLDTNAIDDVVMGISTPIGEQGSVLPRIAAVRAGLPDTVAGVQINRFCASGLDAVNMAAQKVRSGWESLVLAGGVESMSRVKMSSDGGAWADDPDTNMGTSFSPQGIGADLIATLDGFTREDVDAYALESQVRASAARADGRFAKSLVPVTDLSGTIILDHDEYIRPDTTAEGLARLRPAFAGLGKIYDAGALRRYHWLERIDHVHTGGNSSGIVDGAALVLIGSEEAGKSNGLTPRGRIVSTAVSGSDPLIILTGPVPASRKALNLAGLTVDDIDLFEVNEAFASVVLRFMRDLDVDPSKVNVNGGAIALGHPLGATGAMLVGTALDELERRDQRYGLITLCAGAGIGIATVVERL